jgi:hypothetical protein
MKTIFSFSFLLLAYVNGFAPLRLVSQTRLRATTTPRQSKNLALFMMSQVLEETRTVEETKSEIPANPLLDTSVKQSLSTEQLSTEKENDGMSETQNLMQQVKDAGVAGVVSYALWEFGFWTISVPVCILGYREVTG